jgi:hypothetical protein
LHKVVLLSCIRYFTWCLKTKSHNAVFPTHRRYYRAVYFKNIIFSVSGYGKIPASAQQMSRLPHQFPFKVDILFNDVQNILIIIPFQKLHKLFPTRFSQYLPLLSLFCVRSYECGSLRCTNFDTTV